MDIDDLNFSMRVDGIVWLRRRKTVFVNCSPLGPDSCLGTYAVLSDSLLLMNDPA